MKRRWITLISMTLALATAATISAFTLTGGWGDNNDGLRLLPEEVTQSDLADEERVSDNGSGQRTVTSIDDIDPDQCNLFHNIDACSPEQLGLIDIGEPEPGICCKPAESASVEAENTTTGAGSEWDGEPEPLFVDGEPGYVVYSPAEANEMDCGLAGGSVYVTSEGEEGCLIIHDLEDSGEELVSPSEPIIVPEPVAPAQ